MPAAGTTASLRRSSNISTGGDSIDFTDDVHPGYRDLAVASAVELAKIAAALGNPLRVQILDLLAAGRHEPCCSPTHPQAPTAVCACDIAEDLGGLAPSKLAYHLARLRDAGLVNEEKRGKWVYYSLNGNALTELSHTIDSRWARARGCCGFGRRPQPRRR